MSQRVRVARAFPELNVRPGDLSLSPSGQWGSLPRAKKDLSPLRDPLERLGEAGGGDRGGEARRECPQDGKGTVETAGNRSAARGAQQVTEKASQSARRRDQHVKGMGD